MLKATANLKHKLLMEIMYGSGLRVSEVIKLKIKDIDLAEGIIRVNLGKGKKDRQTILSKRAIEDLKTFLETREDDINIYLPELKTKVIYLQDQPRKLFCKRQNWLALKKIFLAID